MAVMHPASCPETANAAERAAFAVLEHFLDAGWTAWFQTPLPGRAGDGRRAPTPLRADFVLLGATGLYIVEVKGWRAASITEADDHVIHFRNGVQVHHPLVQAYRYTAALTGLLREQPGVLRGAAIPVRYAVALPYLSTADLAVAPWAPALAGARLLLADDLGPLLASRLAELPPAGAPLTPAQQDAIRRLFTRGDGRAPSARPLPLFED